MKKFRFIIHGNEYEVSVEEKEENVAQILVNGTPFVVKFERLDKRIAAPPSMSKTPGKVDPIQMPGRKAVAGTIKAPLPGSVMKTLVKEGQTVRRGDVLLTMESMKMENNILAEHDGTIDTIHVRPGQVVVQGEPLVSFTGYLAETKEVIPPPSQINSNFDMTRTAPAKNAQIASGSGNTPVKAPLPGNVLKIAVATGQKVKRGEVLFVLESMKMENNILAEKDAVVGTIHVRQGQSVVQDEVLAELESLP